MESINITNKELQLVLSLHSIGTQTGLPKFIYLRDTRRSMGIFNFKLTHDAMLPNKSLNNSFGIEFKDKIAMGNYPFDMHLLTESNYCENENKYPSYINYSNPNNVPFWIPFRALTNIEMNNLIVVGKCISQSFYANSATRTHPTEWSTGVAGGATAIFMRLNQLNTTLQVYKQIDKFQQFLTSDIIGQPLEWG